MIYFKTSGNLGNVLFEYAAALSLDPEATCYSDDPNVLAQEADFREVMPQIRIVRELPPGVRHYSEPEFHYHPFPSFAPGEDVVLHGYYQSERYFDIPRVRAALALTPERRRSLESRYADWLAPDDVTSIHVRRGDYLKVPHCHPFVGKDYFRKAIAALGDVRHFIVFSNDIVWCEAFFPKEFPDREFRFCAGNTPSEDMHLQSLCRNHIISNSTFSWWGAWLDPRPDKRVLAPSEWFGCFYVAHGVDGRDIYAKGTEVIANPPTPLARLHACWTRLKAHLR